MPLSQTLRVASGAVVFAALLASAGSAAAQQPTQAQISAIKQSCRSDYEAHCADVPTGGKAALTCLQSHESELSEGCRGAVAATEAKTPGAAAHSTTATSGAARSPRERARAMREACGADYRQLCRGTPLGGGRAIGCLEDHHSSLSDRCRAALATAR